MRSRAVVVKLDRGLPLVEDEAGNRYRCKHATALVKGAKVRAAVGDSVAVEVAGTDDVARIVDVLPRRTQLVRKDPTERALPQVLAANFDVVVVAQPLGDINLRRLDRELVVAHETGARVVVVLTKADLVDAAEAADARARIGDVAGDVDVLVVSGSQPEGIEALRSKVGPGRVAVLIGRSGVGKSSLVNLLVGHDVQATTPVRATDGKGRHTTVSREMVDIPGGGRVVDMPGIRGIGMWEAEQGIETAFADIEALANDCRFRDCTHEGEPGCAVCMAVERGDLAPERLDSYRRLRDENAAHAEKKRRRNWK